MVWIKCIDFFQHKYILSNKLSQVFWLRIEFLQVRKSKQRCSMGLTLSRLYNDMLFSDMASCRMTKDLSGK